MITNVKNGTSKNVQKINKKGMILTTRTTARQQMVLAIGAFPNSKKPNCIDQGDLVLLYNSELNLFYAQATYVGTCEFRTLPFDELGYLRNKYPNAYDENWKHRIFLDDIVVFENPFTLEDLNNVATKKLKKHGYTIKLQGNIMYIEDADIPLLNSEFGVKI